MSKCRLAVVLAAVAAGACSTAPAQAARCAAGDVMPTRAPAKARATTLCLINAERTARGLRPLRPNGQLAVAGRRHARDMVRHRYFAHDSLDGRSFDARIRATGYLAGANGWAVGENLAWGVDAQSTPRRIVAAWMASPPHRRNILNRQYRQIGLALVQGAPVANAGSEPETYATEFGRRG